MAAKKHDLPAMPFYFGDWRKAPEIRALDLDVRMIWFEMLGFMWESGERGYLTINGNPVITKTLTKILGVTPDVMERAMQQLEEFDVFSRREDGAIYCRRMVKDEEIRQLRAKAGKKGMAIRYNKKGKPVITKSVTNTENETEIENEGEKENSTGIAGNSFELMGLDFPPKCDNNGNPITLRSSKLEQRYMAVSREGKLKATFEQALCTMHKAIYTQDFEDQKHFENWFMVIAKDKPSITGKPKFVQ